jgi:Fic family protein
MTRYIWECDSWPEFAWDPQRVAPVLEKAQRAQDRFFQRIWDLGLTSSVGLNAHILTEETIQTSAIEG